MKGTDDPAFPCSTAHPWVELPMLGEDKRVSICLGSKEARSAEVTAGLLVVGCCGKLGRDGFGARGGFTMGLTALRLLRFECAEIPVGEVTPDGES